MKKPAPDLLAAYRRSRSLTQADFAALVGCSQPVIARLEGGERNPSLGLAQKIERTTKGAVPALAWPMPVSKAAS